MTLVGSGSAAELSRPYNQFRSSSRLDAMTEKGTRQKAIRARRGLACPAPGRGHTGEKSRPPDPSPYERLARA